MKGLREATAAGSLLITDCLKVKGDNMDNKLYGVLCNHEKGQAIITKEDAKELNALVRGAEENRNVLAEKERDYLHELGQKQLDASLSNEEQKVCEVWNNLNYAIKVLETTFYEECKHEMVNFSEGASKNYYNFLVALARFEEMYPDKNDSLCLI